MKSSSSTRFAVRSARVFAATALVALFSALAVGFTPAQRFESQLAHPQTMLPPGNLAPAIVPDDSPRITFTLPPPPAPALAPTIAPALEQNPPAAVVLRAIANVESQGNPRRVGRLGERGLYQFRRATWRQHTRENFSRAHHPEIATTVAHRHYNWIVRELRANGFEGSPYEVALAWNAGLSRVLAGKVSSASHNYAQRVVNLASDT